MKVNLGNGWYQDVSINENEEQVIRYMKDGKEYSRKDWEQSKLQRLYEKESFIARLRKRLAYVIYPKKSV